VFLRTPKAVNTLLQNPQAFYNFVLTQNKQLFSVHYQKQL